MESTNRRPFTVKPPLESEWTDLYAALGVSGDAPESLLRERIAHLYAEASTNLDHRRWERREHYRILMQQTLPQCKRVLLESKWRALYDAQCRLHETGAGLTYAGFLSDLRNHPLDEMANYQGNWDEFIPGLKSEAGEELMEVNLGLADGYEPTEANRTTLRTPRYTQRMDLAGLRELERRGLLRRGQRVLSETSCHVLAAICGAVLIGVIQYFSLWSGAPALAMAATVTVGIPGPAMLLAAVPELHREAIGQADGLS